MGAVAGPAPVSPATPTAPSMVSVPRVAVSEPSLKLVWRLAMTPLISPLPIGRAMGPSLLNGWPNPQTLSPSTSVQVPMAVISTSPVSSGTASTEPGSSLAGGLLWGPDTPMPACKVESPAARNVGANSSSMRGDIPEIISGVASGARRGESPSPVNCPEREAGARQGFIHFWRWLRQAIGSNPASAMDHEMCPLGVRVDVEDTSAPAVGTDGAFRADDSLAAEPPTPTRPGLTTGRSSMYSIGCTPATGSLVSGQP